MSNHDPFTLDILGGSQSARLSGLGLGVTAFADDPKTKAAEPDLPSVAQANGQTPAAPSRKPDSDDTGHGSNFHLSGSRDLANGWKARARDNLDAIALAAVVAAEDRPATAQEQARLIRFTGFGASNLANAIFTRPGEEGFRKGWSELGEKLQETVCEADYASLARCTQYAHFTPEFIVRAIWKGLQRLGWRGGRILEPGIGTGLFPVLMPEPFRASSFVTGLELDPVTARIARLLLPVARIIEGDFARTDLPAHFDLAIGNPPFSNRIVRSDRAYRSMGLRLHDYFIARSIDLLKPGALAAFVTSSGTMDKVDATAREYIARSADLVAAIRLPEGSFRADAGTDVVVDILFFRKRKPGELQGNASWLDLAEVAPASEDGEAIRVNRWFADHPAHVLGRHATTSGPFGETYTCLAGGRDFAADLDA
ncbi:MAG: N-6 DNA methylase, partial [Hoeflea sp.]|nr:N-6 DNA methylase [Hoeflea sp.]